MNSYSEKNKGPRKTTLDMLPDDVLLEIFSLYVEETSFYLMITAWHTLVHVCRRWRIVVFRSPRRLNLRLQCGTTRQPVRSRETLDIWPPLPIVLWQHDHLAWDMDNVMAALEHNDRVCEIKLWDASSSQLETVLKVMHEPFPTLTNLLLHSRDEMAEVIPDSFLGGSAPRLQELTLHEIAFPGLPKLLSSATHLVKTQSLENSSSRLHFTRGDGYLPLRLTLARDTLSQIPIAFVSSWPGNPTFKGASEYLNDFVVRLDAPMLNKLDITFFHQLIFDIPNLPQFISRIPSLKPHDEACVAVYDSGVRIAPVRPFVRGFPVDFEISCRRSDWQLSSFAQACRSSFPQAFISSLENLYLRGDEYHGHPPLHWPLEDGTENLNAQWLELLLPFTAVKNLYVFKEFAPRIASALQELVGESIGEILPALQGLFLEEVNPAGPVQEAIGQFIATRQLSDHPVVVSHWVREQDELWRTDG